MTIVYLSTGPKRTPLLADSGCPSLLVSYYFLHNARGKPDLEKYMKYLEDNKEFITTYVNADTADLQETKRNMQTMLDHGFKPITVFHANLDPVEVFLEYCETYDYFGIGGAGFVHDMSLRKKMIPYYANLARRYGVKLHGFGMTDFSFIKNYPWYSVDSSSWAGGSRWGYIYHFDKGDLVQTKAKNQLPNETIDSFNCVNWSRYAEHALERGDLNWKDEWKK